MPATAHRVFARMLERPQAWWALLVVASAALGWFAAGVRADYAVEYLFPERSQAKRDYDRYKRFFPYEDARALVIVRAPDLWTPAGLGRLQALERELAALPGVYDVEGPLSIRDIKAVGEDMVVVAPLLEQPALPPAQLAAARRTATTDPLFCWQLSPPTGEAVTIRVTLTREAAGREAERSRFLAALRQVVARQQGEHQQLWITGLPVIRSQYVEVIERDKQLTTGLAVAVILLLLWLTFRSAKEVLAAFCTIAVSVLWTRGVMGILGYPEQILTSILPTVVMIISISDTVHILSHYQHALAAGRARRQALLEAMADSAWPCLLTELTIAAGFLALYFVDIRMISQFGIATACGMVLTWVANMTVLPLLLQALRPRVVAPARAAPAGERLFARAIGWIERQVVHRPRRVVAAALAVLGLAGLGASRMGMEYYAFDDLDPDTDIQQAIRIAERVHGGCNPMVIHIEPLPGSPAEEPMLEPEVVALSGRLAALLERTFAGEVKNALGLADYVRKAHRIFAGEQMALADGLVWLGREAGLELPARLAWRLAQALGRGRLPAALGGELPPPLGAQLQALLPALRSQAAARAVPTSRALLAQELLFIDDGKLLRDVLDFQRRTAAVHVPMPDVGTTRIAEIMRALQPLLAAEEHRLAAAGVPVRLTVTGMFAIGYDIYHTLVEGLLLSLGGALCVSLLVFSAVLGSWRLGLLALVPNVAPLLLTFGIMGALGIDLTPTTVIVFSITLVIADDDTVQFFSRFKRRFLELAGRAAPEPHGQAALQTLREAGLPMVITSCAVSAGFLTLLVSEFHGLRDFGLLVGVSLFAAVFADLFLTPILLRWLRPAAGRGASWLGRPATGRAAPGRALSRRPWRAGALALQPHPGPPARAQHHARAHHQPLVFVGHRRAVQLHRALADQPPRLAPALAEGGGDQRRQRDFACWFEQLRRHAEDGQSLGLLPAHHGAHEVLARSLGGLLAVVRPHDLPGQPVLGLVRMAGQQPVDLCLLQRGAQHEPLPQQRVRDRQSSCRTALRAARRCRWHCRSSWTSCAPRRCRPAAAS
ncbi:MAG: hypothetical protein KatS3mg102_1047 [Planctomycetota bacterium]|nr:MAG: hypothetical protein KatS3mg102_1047 [Planctomycetota bacterium]